MLLLVIVSKCKYFHFVINIHLVSSHKLILILKNEHFPYKITIAHNQLSINHKF